VYALHAPRVAAPSTETTMTKQTSATERITNVLATIARQAELACKRAEQIRGYFENRAATSFLHAIEGIRASELRELSEDALYRELQACIAQASELEKRQLTPEETIELVERFTQRLSSAARRSVEADSSSFMANQVAIARHNAVLRVLEFLEDGIVEATR
jgi:hypothetical protein